MECNDIMVADYSISTTTVKHHKDFRPKPHVPLSHSIVQQGRNKGRMSCCKRVSEEVHEEDKDEEVEAEEEEEE